MKKRTIVATVTCSLLASGLTHAAATTELKVTGVIRPAACTPSFAGGSTVDYGVLPPKSLNPSAPTPLAQKTVPFSVTCDAATRIAIRATDNRKTSVVAGLAADANSGGAAFDDNHAFGLGTVGGKKIGTHVVRLIQGSVTADGALVDVIQETAAAGVWTRSNRGAFLNNWSSRKSFAAVGTTTPGAYKTIAGTLSIQAVIDKASNLDLTGDMPLDGSITLEVQYL
ncbi:DUF1120 domain-containing protein [Herbaspirillum rhizosphaerae]|uniref:DUF1120 domain-containing protein n=1 Tax=Herbaspirillum rhizosphaerae TaxID=346179 RepID=UPI00067E49AC|nr:DUF1120 domain-containing protein [Herbaspirillum rhizosphaerae]